jgi:hypothetical protein
MEQRGDAAVNMAQGGNGPGTLLQVARWSCPH